MKLINNVDKRIYWFALIWTSLGRNLAVFQWPPFRNEGKKNSASLRVVVQITIRIIWIRCLDSMTQEVFSKTLLLIRTFIFPVIWLLSFLNCLEEPSTFSFLDFYFCLKESGKILYLNVEGGLHWTDLS